jgi:hypothetical protein
MIIKDVNDHSIVQGISHPPNHIQSLKEEIEYLKRQIQPHDSGDIYTTISVLESRVKELSGWLIHNY